MTIIVSESLGLSTFLGNFLMLQGIAVPRLGSNAPLWSLANEWWYYIVFALVAGGLLSPASKKRYAFWSLAVIVAAFLPVRLMLWMLVWGVGIIAALWIEHGKRFPPFWLGSIVLCIVLVASRLSHNIEGGGEQGPAYSGLGWDMGLGLAYAFCLVAAAKRLNQSPLMPRLNQHLAEFSYSTYLIHFPVMLFLLAIAYRFGIIGVQIQPIIPSVLFLVIWVAAVYACCYGFFFLFEKHTDKVRRILGDALLQPSRS